MVTLETDTFLYPTNREDSPCLVISGFEIHVETCTLPHADCQIHYNVDHVLVILPLNKVSLIFKCSLVSLFIMKICQAAQ